MRTQRPGDVSEDAQTGHELDLNCILLGQAERALKLQTALRIVDDVSALEAPTAMNKGICLDRIAIELTAGRRRNSLLHGLSLEV